MQNQLFTVVSLRKGLGTINKYFQRTLHGTCGLRVLKMCAGWLIWVEATSGVPTV